LGKRNTEARIIHADDLADACALLLEADTFGLQLPINVGSGRDLNIRDLAELVAVAVGYRGEIEWDVQKPDGAPRKLLDSSRLHAKGWRARIELRDGVNETYAWYQKSVKTAEAIS
jgi:GDP-L-fucose synthase